MNSKSLARRYSNLTPEERFRLILAAGGRGDDSERERLADSAGRITLSMRDFSPYANAFDQLTLLVFIELLEEAAGYFDAFRRADEARDVFGEDDEESDEDGEDEEDQDEEDDEPEGELDPRDVTETAEEDAEERSPWVRSLDLALAAGCVLRTKADGWKLFCERLNVPPFLLWDKLPGFDRIQRALALTEKAAFTPKGFLRWLNRVRPTGEPERAESPMSAEGFADAAEKLFRERVEWWGGD